MPRSSAMAALAAALLTALASQAAAQDKQGAVVQSVGPDVSQKVTLPQLKLTAEDREKLRQAVLTEHNEVEFRTKETQPAKDFEPKVGAKVPPQLKAHGMPQKVLLEVPQLRDYGYVKVKDQILLVDATKRTVADIIPETQPQTTGGQ